MSSSTVVPVSGSEYFGQTAATKKSTLDMSTFLNLLTTQLQNQNPLEPMDDASFFAQIAQLGQVQGMDSLKASADLEQAQTLLGKTVSATRPTSSASGKQGEAFTGVVQSISFKNGAQYLNVAENGGSGTVQIQLSAIQSVLPAADVSNASNLIGKKVAGTANDASGTSVVGVVEGITATNGQAVANVLMNGKYYTVPVASLTQIVNASS